MSNDSTARILQAAIDAAQVASKSLTANSELAGGSGLKTWMKSPGALVTEADIAADKVITASLLASGVPASILSEESTSGDDSSDLTWLVDPLCGTVPYRSGMPHWGVNIAIRRGTQLEVGVIALPPSNCVLAAAVGEGVTLNGEPFTASDPGLPLAESVIGLEVSGGAMWSRLISQNESGNSPLAWPGSISHTNTFASSAYPLALVCTGGMSGVVFYGNDTRFDSVHAAAGIVIAQELGVIVSNERGEPLEPSPAQPNQAAVMAWPSVHDSLIKAMSRS